MSATSESSARSYPVFSRAWAFAMQRVQPKVLLQQRTELAAGLGGTVVEIGCGSGTAFAHYPPTVTQVIAFEPEPYLRAAAETAAKSAPVAVDVRDGVADAIALDDGSVDAAVCSLVLCSVPDVRAALDEAFRVLRPGGELRYLEHVAEPHGTLGRKTQNALDRTGVWPALAGGCHVSRDTGTAIRAAGFAIDTERERTTGPPVIVPVRRTLTGAARKPRG